MKPYPIGNKQTKIIKNSNLLLILNIWLKPVCPKVNTGSHAILFDIQLVSMVAIFMDVILIESRRPSPVFNHRNFLHPLVENEAANSLKMTPDF